MNPQANQQTVRAAAAFSLLHIGPVADGIRPEHIIAVGSHLGSLGLEAEALVACIGAGYELLLGEQARLS